MKSSFFSVLIISFICLVNTTHAQDSLVNHAKLSEGGTYGPVKQEEMLWTIASRFHFDSSVIRNQIMLALFRANPHAFYYPCNMNSLKPGAILQIPSLNTLRTVDRTESIREVRQQEAQWQRRKIQPIHCSQPRSTLEISSNQPFVEFPEVHQEVEGVSLGPSAQNPLTEDFLTAMLEPSLTEILNNLPQAHESAQIEISMTHQGIKDVLLESPVQETPEAEKVSPKDPLWGDAHIISFISLLIGSIIVGGWVTRKLSVPHPDNIQLSEGSESQRALSLDPHEVIHVTIRKEYFQQWKKIQSYGENYRFYPITEALIVGSVTFIAIFLTSYFIFYHALEAQKDEIREGLVRTAQAMVTSIDTQLHQTFTHKEQEETEAYQKAIKPFAQALALNEQIKFIYTIILKDGKIYFILDPTPKGDADGDGVEDSVDIMQEYDDPSGLLGEALRTQRIVVTKEPYTDQWGSLFGAYVPFYDDDGKFIGVLGMDIAADQYFKRLLPIKRATIRAIIAGFFIAFIVGSLVWFTRNFSKVVNHNRLLLIKELKEQEERTS